MLCCPDPAYLLKDPSTATFLHIDVGSGASFAAGRFMTILQLSMQEDLRWVLAEKLEVYQVIAAQGASALYQVLDPGGDGHAHYFQVGMHMWRAAYWQAATSIASCTAGLCPLPREFRNPLIPPNSHFLPSLASSSHSPSHSQTQ